MFKIRVKLKKNSKKKNGTKDMFSRPQKAGSKKGKKRTKSKNIPSKLQTSGIEIKCKYVKMSVICGKMGNYLQKFAFYK